MNIDFLLGTGGFEAARHSPILPWAGKVSANRQLFRLASAECGFKEMETD
jgi:hypothetical protein